MIDSQHYDAKTLLDDIEAGLEGVTPGPWKFHPHYKISGGGYGKIADKPTENRFASATILSVGYKGAEVDDYWISIKNVTADHIARCSPDNIATIIAYVRKLEADNERLRNALLGIDAIDPEKHVYGCSREALCGIVLRMGEIARDALESSGK